MPRFTFTFEGDPAEIRTALLKMLGIGSGGFEGAEAIPVSEWSEDEWDQLWNQINENARKIILECAKNPDGYSFDKLEKTLKLQMKTIGAQLNSINLRLRRFPGKPRPVIKDLSNRQYKMDVAVAKILTGRN